MAGSFFLRIQGDATRNNDFSIAILTNGTQIPDNLIEAIKTLHQDDELKEHFSKEGKNTVEFFGVDRMVKETRQVLRG